MKLLQLHDKPSMAKVTTVEALRFMTDCFRSVGVCPKPAEQQADLLLQADRCGHSTHGLNRLERYILDITNGICCPNNEPKLIKETAATAWIHANNVLGATAGHFATDIAIKKAKESGIGWVSVKGSNHYGMGGFWAQKMTDAGLIGFAFSNGSPLVAPSRSKKAALGTNPITVVAPGTPKSGPFYLDMAVSAVAIGRIEMALRKGEKLPLGWALDLDGKETTDPAAALKAGCLMPLGGAEASGGYKGFALAALVDLLSGMLSGSAFGHHVKRWTPTGKSGPANLGQCFVAVDHKCFAPDFEERVSESILHWRSLPPSDPKLPVMAPGDLEKRAAARTDKTGQIIVIKALLDSTDRLAKKLNVKPIKRQNECK